MLTFYPHLWIVNAVIIGFRYFAEATFASKFEVMVHFVPALREFLFDSVRLLVVHVDTGYQLSA